MLHTASPVRAVWFAAPRVVELRDEVAPSPRAGEVRVQTLHSALSQGTEMLVYRGEVSPAIPLDLPTLSGSFAFPIKHGYAAVGRVLDVGAGVDGLAPSDVVFSLHPHQSVFTAPASLVTRLPFGLEPELGVFTANVETAVNVLLDAAPRLGETVVVFGQGTVGLLITQLLRRAGAGCVIVVEPMARRRELSRALGADHALSPEEASGERIRALTGGRGADLAIEVSGRGAALQSAVECVATEGTVVAVSWYGTKPVTLDLGGHFHRGRVRIISSQVGRLNPALAPRWDHDRRMATVLELLPTLRLTELISHRIPFEDAAQAYQLVDERPEETVQVTLTYDVMRDA